MSPDARLELGRVEYHDTLFRLRNLFDAAFDIRAYLEREAKWHIANGEPQVARRIAANLERLDAALADVQEVLP